MQPAAAHLASVPPAPNSTSSGWAATASARDGTARFAVQARPAAVYSDPALRGAYALISVGGQEPCAAVDDPGGGDFDWAAGERTLSGTAAPSGSRSTS